MKILIPLLFLLGCDVTDYVAHYSLYRGDTYVSIGQTLKWRMDIQHVNNVTMVHIHCLPSNAIGVTFNPPPHMGVWDQLSGEENAPDKNNACGWKTFEDLKADISKGNAYVKVYSIERPAGHMQATLEKK